MTGKWQDIVKILDRTRPAGPQPLMEDPPTRGQTRSKTRSKSKAADMDYEIVEDKTEVAAQEKDECVCRNPLCNMRATYKCRNCGHQSCDIHKEILESFKSPTTGNKAKDVHNFQPWDCKKGGAGQYVDDRKDVQD